MADSEGIYLTPVPISREAYREALRRKSHETVRSRCEKLVRLLVAGPLGVTEAAESLGIPRRLLYPLLRKGLQDGALLKRRQKGEGKGGTHIVYSIKPAVSSDLAVAIILGEFDEQQAPPPRPAVDWRRRWKQIVGEINARPVSNASLQSVLGLSENRVYQLLTRAEQSGILDSSSMKGAQSRGRTKYYRLKPGLSPEQAVEMCLTGDQRSKH